MPLTQHAQHPPVASIFNHNVAIGTCERQSEWQQALLLLAAVRGATAQANTFSFCPAISACAKGRRWAHALALLGRLGEETLEATIAPSLKYLNYFNSHLLSSLVVIICSASVGLENAVLGWAVLAGYCSVNMAAAVQIPTYAHGLDVLASGIIHLLSLGFRFRVLALAPGFTGSARGLAASGFRVHLLLEGSGFCGLQFMGFGLV